MNLYRALPIIAISIFCSIQLSSAREITEENYLKVDKEIWEEYERDMAKISGCYKLHPEKKDSLIAVSEQVYAIASRKNKDAAIKYASVPSGLQRLYMVRLGLPKDTVLNVLKSLPDSMQNSPYGKSILYHIESEQVKEGDKYYDFKATDAKGNSFALSSLTGKNILLLYGGLNCMGGDGRSYLNEIYRGASRDDFEIVVYCLDSDLESLQKAQTDYSCDYLLVSDFLQDHTPVKILYGAQAMPTCFFIDREGSVIMKTEGLDQKRVTRLLEENK